jgi:Brp/Blh family beta-carotene 15,15'-monooxygenase
MTKITFVFISCFFLLLALYTGVSEYNTAAQVIPAIVCIALLGIPHGAIDHLLFLEKSTWSPLLFYTFYLGLIALYVVAWLLAPTLSMGLFLVLSAYHFGQSQFTDLKQFKRKLKPFLYLSWGLTVLAGLIYFNRAEIAGLAETSPEMAAFSGIMNPQLALTLMAISGIVTLGILGYGLIKNHLTFERFGIEILVMGLIQFSFMVFPILTGFTLFFVVIHSLKVLTDEYDFMQKVKQRFTIKGFLKMLLPYTLLSLFGSAFLLLISHFEYMPISNLLLVFILISVLTLPHSIVMEVFYRKR